MHSIIIPADKYLTCINRLRHQHFITSPVALHVQWTIFTGKHSQLTGMSLLYPTNYAPIQLIVCRKHCCVLRLLTQNHSPPRCRLSTSPSLNYLFPVPNCNRLLPRLPKRKLPLVVSSVSDSLHATHSLSNLQEGRQKTAGREYGLSNSREGGRL